MFDGPARCSFFIASVGVLYAGRFEIHIHSPLPRLPPICHDFLPEAHYPICVTTSFYRQASSRTTSGAWWEGTRTVKQQEARDARKLLRSIAFQADPGPWQPVPGPEAAGQACSGCLGHNHFALRCLQQPKLCGPCCRDSPQGTCTWHNLQTSGIARARANRPALG